MQWRFAFVFKIIPSVNRNAGVAVRCVMLWGQSREDVTSSSTIGQLKHSGEGNHRYCMVPLKSWIFPIILTVLNNVTNNTLVMKVKEYMIIKHSNLKTVFWK
jgi:hypothetical protein